MRSRLALGCVVLFTLAACHRHKADEDQPPVETNAVEAPAPVAPPSATENQAEAPKPEKVAAPPKAAPVSEEQQMSDDADATGLTARAERGGDDGDAPKDESAQPATTGNTG